jgi:hypothetical protein
MPEPPPSTESTRVVGECTLVRVDGFAALTLQNPGGRPLGDPRSAPVDGGRRAPPTVRVVDEGVRFFVGCFHPPRRYGG